MNPADRPATEPRTEAGRDLMETPFIEADYDGCTIDTGMLLTGILAIEAEAAQGAAPLHERGYIPLIDNRLRCKACEEPWPCEGAAPRAEGLVGCYHGRPHRCSRCSFEWPETAQGAAPRVEGPLHIRGARTKGHRSCNCPDCAPRAEGPDLFDDKPVPREPTSGHLYHDSCDTTDEKHAEAAQGGAPEEYMLVADTMEAAEVAIFGPEEAARRRSEGAAPRAEGPHLHFGPDGVFTAATTCASCGVEITPRKGPT